MRKYHFLIVLHLPYLWTTLKNCFVIKIDYKYGHYWVAMSHANGSSARRIQEKSLTWTKVFVDFLLLTYADQLIAANLVCLALSLANFMFAFYMYTYFSICNRHGNRSWCSGVRDSRLGFSSWINSSLEFTKGCKLLSYKLLFYLQNLMII